MVPRGPMVQRAISQNQRPNPTIPPMKIVYASAIQPRSSAVTRVVSCPCSRNSDINMTCGTVKSDDHPVNIKGSKGP